MRTLTLDLDRRSYPIHIGAGLLTRSDLFVPHIKGSRVALVTNEAVAPLYLDKVLLTFAAYTPVIVVLPDGEQHKTLGVLNSIFDKLLDAHCDRRTTLLALGGGVIGDLTGFAAACYQRGVPFIQIPTTLLAQVDSSVGGKTGVNHALGKNMIGAFYQPRAVIIDTETLKTLPDKELSAGLAEVIKYGLIRDPDFFSWLEVNIDKLLSREPEALAYAIERSCRNKAEVVAVDETEGGVRAILNFGHTFGHAIEAGMGYGSWLHGEAVAAGMVMAANLSHRLGWLQIDDVKRIENLIQRARLPIRAPNTLSPEDFFKHMTLDKKTLDGKIRLVLLKSLGHATVVEQISTEPLRETLKQR